MATLTISPADLKPEDIILAYAGEMLDRKGNLISATRAPLPRPVKVESIVGLINNGPAAPTAHFKEDLTGQPDYMSVVSADRYIATDYRLEVSRPSVPEDDTEAVEIASKLSRRQRETLRVLSNALSVPRSTIRPGYEATTPYGQHSRWSKALQDAAKAEGVEHLKYSHPTDYVAPARKLEDKGLVRISGVPYGPKTYQMTTLGRRVAAVLPTAVA